ncbi:hypothetical protein G7Y79_00005g017610 [Physcia stellaris]|nr:hypothetical protein G7Y79_00005g017610 [Physcia stellaris]
MTFTGRMSSRRREVISLISSSPVSDFGDEFEFGASDDEALLAGAEQQQQQMLRGASPYNAPAATAPAGQPDSSNNPAINRQGPPPPNPYAPQQPYQTQQPQNIQQQQQQQPQQQQQQNAFGLLADRGGPRPKRGYTHSADFLAKLKPAKKQRRS